MAGIYPTRCALTPPGLDLRPLDPWETPDGFERIVVAFSKTGITEFIVMWPTEDRLRLLEPAASMMASLKHS